MRCKKKIAFSRFLIIAVLAMPLIAYGGDSGTFRGNWWNYYDRAMEYSESTEPGFPDKAFEDLKEAISMRSKDQRMARTYGMHFIDYFPHRELGIAYFKKGDIDNAISELEQSLGMEESAKAIFYLNKARKTKLLQLKDKHINPPAITVASPVQGSALKEMTTTIKGNVSGDGFVSKVLINNIPYRFERSAKDVPFESVIPLDDGDNSIVITAEDLLGNISGKTVSVLVNREGPAINIFDIITENKDGKKYITVTGEINDSTGIRNVIFNGDNKEVNDAKSYIFNISLERKYVQNKFLIQAFDNLGNTTTAELDLESELSAFNKIHNHKLLAFNGSSLFSSDKEPPVLHLKDAAEVPHVLVDRYYVEGEAFDNQRVDRILINSREVSMKKGKKIFFSKVIKLNEGDNRIVVEAFDSSGNRAVSEFTVRRQIPLVMQVSSRMSISILPFEVKRENSETGRLAYEQLIGSFVDQKRFLVIERAKLEQVLMEQKLAREKLTDVEHSIRVGRLIGSDSILATSIAETHKSIEIISRVINTETSEIMDVKDVFAEDKSLSTVKDLIEGLALKIAQSFPVVEGMVIKTEKKEIFADIGNTSKIRNNAGVIVYRKGKEIRHPVSGKSLGWDTIKLGEGYVEQVQEGFSKIRLSDKFRNQEVNVKDLIVTK
ncbi:MAG: hypothetical protein HQL08_13235 [Nitrospirae bacterium]|nr:hypothetical protein [Nitrospirota bacterium]